MRRAEFTITGPAHGYAAPAYAPAMAGKIVIIVTASPAYTAPPVVSGCYAAPVVSQPVYGYTPGYWNRAYWGRMVGRW